MDTKIYGDGRAIVRLHGDIFDGYLTIEDEYGEEHEDAYTIARMCENNPDRLVMVQNAGPDGLILVPAAD